MKTFLNYLISIIILVGTGSKAYPSESPNDPFSSLQLETQQISNEFGITGSEELCLYYGSIIGDFSGGGLATDVFSWKIFKADGSVIVEREGGFQTFSHTFSEIGKYEIQLTVRRGLDVVFSGSKNLLINGGADIVIDKSYLLCGDGKVSMTLLNPETTNLNAYQITWKDGTGKVIGTGNNIEVNKADKYTADFFTVNDMGLEVCPFSASTFVYQPKEFKLAITNPTVCEGVQSTTVSAGNSVFGKWFYQKQGTADRVFLGEGNSREIVGGRDLDGPGQYQIIFEVDNSKGDYCKTEEFVLFTVNQHVGFTINFEKGVENCGSNDGALVIEALTDMRFLRIRRDGVVFASFTNLVAGQIIRIPNLSPGLYVGGGALGDCSRSTGVVVPLINPPTPLRYTVQEIIDEQCSSSGIVEGEAKIRMQEANFTGKYRLLTTTGNLVKSGEVSNVEVFSIFASAGSYILEVSDAADCINPRSERIVIRAKPQVIYSIPDRITICEFFDFTPTTSQNLFFTLRFPDNTEVTKKKGESFRLDQAGEYVLLGFENSSAWGFCPKEERIFVTVNQQVKYEPKLISSDCFGNKQYQANLFGADPSRYTIKWYNEKGLVVGNAEFLFPTSFGEFKLEVQPKNSEVCPTTSIPFLVENLTLSVEVSLQASTLCPGGFSQVVLQGESEDIHFIRWLFIDTLGFVSSLDEFDDIREIQVQNPGTYEAVVFNEKNCEIGRNMVAVSVSENLAEFDIPKTLHVCETYDLTPTSSLDLTYSVILPSGEIVGLNDEGLITITESGEYTFTAISADSDVPLCSVNKKMTVTQSQAVPFEPVLFSQSCNGELVYEANLFGKNPSEVDIFWINEKSEMVGSEQFLTPESEGTFSLEVRPKGSLQCQQPNQKEFKVVNPIVSLDVNLTATPFCQDADLIVISLDTAFDKVSKIKWYHTDFNGNRKYIAGFNDKRDISVSKEGTYEVEVYNKNNCLIGMDRIMVMRSVDESRPEVDAINSICLALGKEAEINPGNFDQYFWTLGGILVSESPIFSPTVSGKYSLTVVNFDGCSFSVPFEVVDECTVQITHTTGMRANDPQRPFKVYANPLIDEVGVWIYNQWGQLVFHCADYNDSTGIGSCEWSGEKDGRPAEVGNYAVKISYKNNFENVVKSTWGSLTIVE